MNQRPVRRHRRLFAQRLEDRRLLAGPYAPAAGQLGSTAVAMDDPSIVGWATGVADYSPGAEVNPEFQQTDRALGPAEGTASDVVSLGRGGMITLTFADPIRDGLGFDFAVFENAFSDTFLELGFVEVSSNGTDFFRFPSDSLTPAPVGAFGEVDPTEIDQLAGKYRAGFGTPFDLNLLHGVDLNLDVSKVTHVRLIDVIGDGSATDASGDPIYDPFPTIVSAGLDVDAVAVLHAQTSAGETIGFEDVGALLTSESFFNGPVAGGDQITGPFNDQVVVGNFDSGSLTFNNAHSLDFGSWNQFAYSNSTDTVTPGFGNQFSSYAGGGADDSATFAVGFPDQGDFFDPPTIRRQIGDVRRFGSFQVTNTTYAALSMRDGDAFAKKFGGPSGNDPDFLLLSIIGKDSLGDILGTIDVYLADYRFSDNSLDYILDEWIEVDLGPVADAASIEFAIDSSDVGDFGINTPAFFAIDNITLVQPVLPLDLADRVVSERDGIAATFARVSRPDSDTSQSVEVTIAPVDPAIVNLPSSVTIEVGERFVEFPIDVIDNDRFHGTRSVVIEASAAGWVASSQTLTVQDDDEPQIQLTLPASLGEGQSATATVTRNDANLDNSIVVSIASSDPSLVSVPSEVTIAAGQASADFSIMATEDDIHRTGVTVEINVSSSAHVGNTETVGLVDNDPPALTVDVTSGPFSESDGVPSATFEDLGRRLPPESFYNGADLAGDFVSNGVRFNNEFNPLFEGCCWSGWAYSNITDTTTAGFVNQYSAFAGGGSLDSDTYAVASTFTTPRVKRDPNVHGSFQTIDITNTTYAALSMMLGDAFSKQFGGPSGNDPDFFLLTIEGWDATAGSVGTVEFYLADYRFDNNDLDYIVDQWTTVDVSSLASAVELTFQLSSSDVGDFGINTPLYFAADRFTFDDPRPARTIRVGRNTADVSEPLTVQLSSSDRSEIQLPASWTVPAGLSSVEVPITVIDDSLVDGTQSVAITATANGFVDAAGSISVADNDIGQLTLTILDDDLFEGDSGRAVVHRNVADTSDSLEVSITVDVMNQVVAAPVVIPTGARSVEFTLSVLDNDVIDADRTVTITAEASSLASDSGELIIRNDDVPPPVLSLSFDPGQITESDSGVTQTTAVVTRSDDDLSEALQVILDADVATEIVLPSSVEIPAGSDRVSFVIEAVDDSMVDGDQIVTVTAAAEGHVSSAAAMTVLDDDVPTITLSLTSSQALESSGSSASRLVVHRNTVDLSESVTVYLSHSGDEVLMRDQIRIRPGEPSASVDVGILDNLILDGDRTARFDAMAEGFESSSVVLTIIDNELAQIDVMQTDGATIVNEFAGADQLQVSLASKPQSNVVVNAVFDDEDIALDLHQLIFTPKSWNTPQIVHVTGLPDLVIDPETVVVQWIVDDAASHPLFAGAHAEVSVQVLDQQPSMLRVVEDGQSVMLVDEESGITILRSEHAQGLDVNASAFHQTVHLEPLVATSGPITIDTGDGNDVVWLCGTHFESLAGGDGMDRLRLSFDHPVEMIPLLGNRISGFEEFVIASDVGAAVEVDLDRLIEIAPAVLPIVLRVESGQDLRLHGEAQMTDPIMHGSDFAQVIRAGEHEVRVITPNPWQNSFSRWDTNFDGEVTAVDALVAVNALARRSDPSLPPIESLTQFGGVFFDVNGDERLTARDPLAVINEIARRQDSTEAEWVPVGSRSDDASLVAVNRQSGVVETRVPKIIGMPEQVDRVIESVWGTEEGAVSEDDPSVSEPLVTLD